MSVFLGVIGGAYTIAEGPPWPTDPVVSAQSPSFGSPFDVPFNVSNKSGLFDIKNLSIHCEIRYLDAARLKLTKDFKGKLLFPSIGPNPILRATDTSAFTCPFSRYLDALGLGASALENPRDATIILVFEYRSPWTIFFPSLSMRKGETIFTLDTATQPARWILGVPLR